MEYFITPEEDRAAVKRTTPEHLQRMCRIMPERIVQLDAAVSSLVLQALQSSKGEQFRRHLDDARVALLQNPQHVEASYVFRADYMISWCREMWRFNMTRDSRVQLVTSSKEFRKICPHCLPSCGYQGPHRVENRWVDRGSEYQGPTISEESKAIDRMLGIDLMQMRANCDFDEAVKLMVVALEELKLLMMDYKILVFCIHRSTDGRTAISPSFSINPSMVGLREDYSFAIRRVRQYYAPCDYCKGEGCVSEVK